MNKKLTANSHGKFQRQKYTANFRGKMSRQIRSKVLSCTQGFNMIWFRFMIFSRKPRGSITIWGPSLLITPIRPCIVNTVEVWPQASFALNVEKVCNTIRWLFMYFSICFLKAILQTRAARSPRHTNGFDFLPWLFAYNLPRDFAVGFLFVSCFYFVGMLFFFICKQSFFVCKLFFFICVKFFFVCVYANESCGLP